MQKQTVFSSSNHFNTASHVFNKEVRSFLQSKHDSPLKTFSRLLPKMNDQFAATYAALAARLTKVFTLATESANLASERSKVLTSQYEIAKADAHAKQLTANTPLLIAIAKEALDASTRIGCDAISAQTFEVAQFQAMKKAEQAAVSAKMFADVAQSRITASPCQGIPLPETSDRKQTDEV